jgi:hypothetical protein
MNGKAAISTAAALHRIKRVIVVLHLARDRGPIRAAIRRSLPTPE